MPGLLANACLEEPDALIALVRVCGGAPRATGGLYPEISNIQHGITNVQVGCRLDFVADWMLRVLLSSSVKPGSAATSFLDHWTVLVGYWIFKEQSKAVSLRMDVFRVEKRPLVCSLISGLSLFDSLGFVYVRNGP